MKIEPLRIKYGTVYPNRQFDIRLDNGHLYVLSMAVINKTDERIKYVYSLFDGNRTLFKGDEFSTSIGWEVLGLKSVCGLLDFLTESSDKWPSDSDYAEIVLYVLDLEL